MNRVSFFKNLQLSVSHFLNQNSERLDFQWITQTHTRTQVSWEIIARNMINRKDGYKFLLLFKIIDIQKNENDEKEKKIFLSAKF